MCCFVIGVVQQILVVIVFDCMYEVVGDLYGVVRVLVVYGLVSIVGLVCVVCVEMYVFEFLIGQLQCVVQVVV